MIVDDEPLFQELMQDIFKSADIELTSAYNGDQALSYPEQDLYVLDLGMPGMDGKTTSDALMKKFGHPVPIILITGYDINTLENLEKQPNIQRILQKPFDVDELKALIQKHFENTPSE